MPFKPGPVPQEALDYLKAKQLKVGFDYRDVWNDEHARQFTVAKVTQLDVLQSIQGSLTKALEEGQTFDTWRKNLRPELEKAGWWGKREVVDDQTGEIKITDLSSPRRLGTIYETNLRTARAAGQWERIQRTKALLPYLIYEVGPSREHRPEHLSWHGTVLPVDDPWWQSHATPNGWGCKCHIRQVGEREHARLVDQGVPTPLAYRNPGAPTRSPAQTTAPKVELRKWINQRTGEIEQVPKGIDPGFGYNPGTAARQAQLLRAYADKLEGAAPALAESSIRSMMESGVFATFFQKPQGAFPVGLLNAADAALIGSKARTVRLSAESAIKQQGEHAEIQAAEYAAVQDTIRYGHRIQDGPLSLVYVLDEPDGYVTVVKSTRSGETLLLASFRRLSRDEGKRDRELQRLLAKDRGKE